MEVLIDFQSITRVTGQSVAAQRLEYSCGILIQAGTSTRLPSQMPYHPCLDWPTSLRDHCPFQVILQNG